MSRLLFLDSLRGLAALAVALFHYTTIYRSFYGHSFSKSFDFDYGLYGVELFFMISGFVIFYSFDKISSGKEFLLNRVIRLYPTYWFCLIVTFLCVQYFGLNKLTTTINDLFINFTMFQKLFRVPNVDGVYWSLFSEWMFYLMMLGLFVTKKLDKILHVGTVWVLLCLIHKYFFSFGFLGALLNLSHGVFFYAGILFFLYYKKRANTKILKGHLLFVCLTAIALYIPKGNVQAGIVIGFFIVFYLGINGKLDFLANRILLFLGSISFAFYLFHQNIGYIIMNQTKGFFGDSLLILVLPLTISLLCSYWITNYLEQPIVQMLKNWYIRKKGVPLPGSKKVIPSSFTKQDTTH